MVEHISEIEEGSILEATTFEGMICTGSFQQSLTFVAHAGSDCRLIVDPLVVPAETYIALSKLMGKPGGSAEAVTLEGRSIDGIDFFSRHMEVSGTSFSTDAFLIQLATGEASITYPLRGRSHDTAAAVKLCLRGFKSFRPAPVQALLGKVVVQGAHKVSSPDEVSGAIIVRCASGQPDESWYREAESLAEFVWNGLQFGHGGGLHVPLVQEFRPNAVVSTFYNGSGRPAHLPAIHFLDQSAFIEALVARFESEEPFPDAVWQAASWLNNDSSIDEVRYLTLMTAIETILHSLVPEGPSTLIPKGKFGPIREFLIQALEGFELSQEDARVLASNIKQINRAPLSRRLEAAIDKYALPPDVFDAVLIRRLSDQRISIVHQGRSLEGDDIWECILYARELIALIVLSELGYKGRYESYAGGHKQLSVSEVIKT